MRMRRLSVALAAMGMMAIGARDFGYVSPRSFMDISPSPKHKSKPNRISQKKRRLNQRRNNK